MAANQAHLHVMTNNPAKFFLTLSEELQSQSVTGRMDIDHYYVPPSWSVGGQQRVRGNKLIKFSSHITSHVVLYQNLLI